MRNVQFFEISIKKENKTVSHLLRLDQLCFVYNVIKKAKFRIISLELQRKTSYSFLERFVTF